MVLILIMTGIFLYIKFFITDEIEKIACDYASSCVTESVNESVLSSFDKTVEYSDLIEIIKDKNGDISYINANAVKVNALSRLIALKSERLLKEKMNSGVPVAIMVFTGINFLSGFGKTVNLKILSINSVDCSFESEFLSVGINQTVHSVYSVINCEINIEMPLKNPTKNFSSRVLLSETVLVGKVPEVYLNGNIF